MPLISYRRHYATPMMIRRQAADTPLAEIIEPPLMTAFAEPIPAFHTPNS
jgi:hypothetical protein